MSGDYYSIRQKGQCRLFIVIDKAQYIERFKTLHKEKQGKDIDDATALECFEKLVELVRNVYRPMPTSRKQDLECLLKK